MKLTQKLSTTTQTKRLEKMRRIPRTAAETAPGTVLKTAPKGFPKDYTYLKYLQCKEYTVACCQPDSFFLAPDFLDRTDDIFKQMKRFSDFVNYTIDDFE